MMIREANENNYTDKWNKDKKEATIGSYYMCEIKDGQ